MFYLLKVTILNQSSYFKRFSAENLNKAYNDLHYQAHLVLGSSPPQQWVCPRDMEFPYEQGYTCL